jgi:Ser/Thr protein kinase RdoA (MazF antagonist)
MSSDNGNDETVLPTWLRLVSDGRTAAGGDRLRHWGLSETWRVRWTDGPTTIVKRGAGEEALALDVYQRLLTPCQITAPQLLATHRGEDFVVLMFEDLGCHTLASQPSVDGWLASARLLARMRHHARSRLPATSPFQFTTTEIIHELARASAALAEVRPDLADALDHCEPVLTSALHRLAATVPVTIIHGDFESKNLVLTGSGPCPVDWSTAHVGAHLGDLYSLVRDANLVGTPTDAIVAAYTDECAVLGAPIADMAWQLAVGGTVWTVRALRWVLEEGVHVLPESITWINELVERAGDVTDELANLSREDSPSP